MNDKSWWLIVDDTRNIHGDIIARNAEVGLSVLRGSGDKIGHLAIDHDLGTGPSGYDLLLSAIRWGILPPHIQIISMNPAGRKRMHDLLLENGYENDGSSDYWRS